LLIKKIACPEYTLSLYHYLDLCQVFSRKNIPHAAEIGVEFYSLFSLHWMLGEVKKMKRKSFGFGVFGENGGS
jgi:hypothetical protein